VALSSTLKCGLCLSDDDCGGGTCHGVCEKCAIKAVKDAVKNCGGTANVQSTSTEGGRLKNACISTAWLKERDLEHASIRAGTMSKVYCISDNLPCATPGHLLRDTTSGKFLSYSEVCEMRLDCVESFMLVSQLDHTFDWSVYRSSNLELTSLSVHPLSTHAATAYLIANAADILNRAGLGVISNTIALIPVRYAIAMESIIRTFSLSSEPIV